MHPTRVFPSRNPRKALTFEDEGAFGACKLGGKNVALFGFDLHVQREIADTLKGQSG